MRKSKSDIKPELLPKKDSEVYSSEFAFRKDVMMVSYVPRQKKAVSLLSTKYSDASIDESIGDKQKPSVVTFYNGTKGGLDTADKNVLQHLAQDAQIDGRYHCSIPS